MQSNFHTMTPLGTVKIERYCEMAIIERDNYDTFYFED